jgi:hypothetical protein
MTEMLLTDNKYVNTTQLKNVIAILFIVSDRHLT